MSRGNVIFDDITASFSLRAAQQNSRATYALAGLDASRVGVFLLLVKMLIVLPLSVKPSYHLPKGVYLDNWRKAISFLLQHLLLREK